MNAGIALFFLAAIQIADIWTTARILRAGGRENNGIVAALMAAAGSWWAVLKYGTVTATGIALAHYDLVWAIWVANAGMTAIVDSNWDELRRMGR